MNEFIPVSEDLLKIINFVQKCELHTYHPIKKKYIVTQSFIHENKRLAVGTKIYLPRPMLGKAKPDPDQTFYNKNVELLKQYIDFRVAQGEGRFEYKEITFSPDFTSIRIGSAL